MSVPFSLPFLKTQTPPSCAFWAMTGCSSYRKRRSFPSPTLAGGPGKRAAIPAAPVFPSARPCWPRPCGWTRDPLKGCPSLYLIPALCRIITWGSALVLYNKQANKIFLDFLSRTFLRFCQNPFRIFHSTEGINRPDWACTPTTHSHTHKDSFVS